MNKRHTLFNDCVKELKLVFRDSEDLGDKRKKTTPDKDILLMNLERFCDKWIHIGGTDSKSGLHELFRDDFMRQIEHLKGHIKCGCISGLLPGYSTSINESLHEKLNALFAGAKMGPELAFALLTIFFYCWNSKRKNKVNGVQIVNPITKLKAEMAKKEFCDPETRSVLQDRTKNNNTEKFGLGVSNHDQEEEEPYKFQMCKEKISRILDCTLNKLIKRFETHEFKMYALWFISIARFV